MARVVGHVDGAARGSQHHRGVVGPHERAAVAREGGARAAAPPRAARGRRGCVPSRPRRPPGRPPRGSRRRWSGAWRGRRCRATRAASCGCAGRARRCRRPRRGRPTTGWRRWTGRPRSAGSTASSRRARGSRDGPLPSAPLDDTLARTSEPAGRAGSDSLSPAAPAGRLQTKTSSESLRVAAHEVRGEGVERDVASLAVVARDGRVAGRGVGALAVGTDGDVDAAGCRRFPLTRRLAGAGSRRLSAGRRGGSHVVPHGVRRSRGAGPRQVFGRSWTDIGRVRLDGCWKLSAVSAARRGAARDAARPSAAAPRPRPSRHPPGRPPPAGVR